MLRTAALIALLLATAASAQGDTPPADKVRWGGTPMRGTPREPAPAADTAARAPPQLGSSPLAATAPRPAAAAAARRRLQPPPPAAAT